MRDQRLSIELPFCNELQRFLTVAAVNASGLEDQIFAVHIRQRQGLCLIIKRHHRDDRIRASALPCKLGRILLYCNILEAMAELIAVGTAVTINAPVCATAVEVHAVL